MNSKSLVFVGMGFELIGIILGCLFIGQYIDQSYHGKGLGVVIFSVIGLVGWIIHLIRLLKYLDAKESSDSK